MGGRWCGRFFPCSPWHDIPSAVCMSIVLDSLLESERRQEGSAASSVAEIRVSTGAD